MDIKKEIESIRISKGITNSYVPDLTLFDNSENFLYENISLSQEFVFFKNTEYSFRQTFVYLIPGKFENQLNITNSVFEFIKAKISNLEEEPLHNWAIQNGFVTYKTFNRMMSLRKEQVLVENLELIKNPEFQQDFVNIKTFLEKNFDIFAERIPNVEELKKLRNSTYLIKQNDEIAALLVSEKKGVTEELRYWLVSENYRKLKYGSLLMRHFLNKNTDSKRFTLWVESTNDNAIQKYHHFGFINDKITNEIYITKDLKNEK